MKAAVFKAPGLIETETVPDPVCARDGIILQVKACGICGSDLRLYLSGDSKLKLPYIMGHEIAGIVAEVGPDVSGYQLGQAFALAPGIYCGKCYYCERGQQNQCTNLRAFGGGMAEYMALSHEILDHGTIHSIDPQKISFAEATLAEPSSSVIHAQAKAGIGPEDAVVIIGAGPIGCLHIQVARARGARQIISLELSETRRQGALAFGPDVVADPSQVDAAAFVRERTGGLGADVAIVACPSGAAQSQALYLVRNGGQVVLFGGLPADKPNVTFDGNLIHYREITVRGAYGYPAHRHATALDLIERGKIQAQRMITHRMPLEGADEGMHLMQAGEALKVVLEP